MCGMSLACQELLYVACSQTMQNFFHPLMDWEFINDLVQNCWAARKHFQFHQKIKKTVLALLHNVLGSVLFFVLKCLISTLPVVGSFGTAPQPSLKDGCFYSVVHIWPVLENQVLRLWRSGIKHLSKMLRQTLQLASVHFPSALLLFAF